VPIKEKIPAGNDDTISEDASEIDVPTSNSSIEKLLNLKYKLCKDLFSPEFLTTNNIGPDWRAAQISGKEY
jgi:hypothetical protein